MNPAFPIPYVASEHEAKFIAHFGEEGLRPMHAKGDKGRKTYIICFTNRCGSNMLAELIATNPAFGKAGEYLNAPGVLRNATRREHKTMAQHLNWLRRAKASAHGIFGIKLSYRQLFFLARTGFVSGMFGDVRFVHIRRRNVLDQAISHAIASQTKTWTSKQAAAKDAGTADFKPAHIARLMDSINEANAKFRTYFEVFGFDAVDVVYEDLVEDVQSQGDRVLRGIGFCGPDVKVNPGLTLLRKQGNALNDSFAQKFREYYQRTLK